jgi:hypothetical protein
VVELEGSFESWSTLILLSIPFCLWAYLSENRGLSLVGLVKSRNAIIEKAFILATTRCHACGFGFLLTDNHFSAFNRDSSYLSLEYSV